MAADHGSGNSRVAAVYVGHAGAPDLVRAGLERAARTAQEWGYFVPGALRGVEQGGWDGAGCVGWDELLARAVAHRPRPEILFLNALADLGENAVLRRRRMRAAHAAGLTLVYGGIGVVPEGARMARVAHVAHTAAGRQPGARILHVHRRGRIDGTGCKALPSGATVTIRCRLEEGGDTPRLPSELPEGTDRPVRVRVELEVVVEVSAGTGMPRSRPGGFCLE